MGRLVPIPDVFSQDREDTNKQVKSLFQPKSREMNCHLI